MPVNCTEEERRLTAAVTGELDHHGAKAVMEELDRRIDAALPRELTLDLGGLTFTDSSGIANTPGQAEKVFRAAGLQRIIRFEERGRPALHEGGPT